MPVGLDDVARLEDRRGASGGPELLAPPRDQHGDPSGAGIAPHHFPAPPGAGGRHRITGAWPSSVVGPAPSGISAVSPACKSSGSVVGRQLQPAVEHDENRERGPGALARLRRDPLGAEIGAAADGSRSVTAFAGTASDPDRPPPPLALAPARRRPGHAPSRAPGARSRRSRRSAAIRARPTCRWAPGARPAESPRRSRAAFRPGRTASHPAAPEARGARRAWPARPAPEPSAGPWTSTREPSARGA